MFNNESGNYGPTYQQQNNGPTVNNNNDNGIRLEVNELQGNAAPPPVLRLRAEPESIQVPADGITWSHNLINYGNTRLAYKVKTSNNKYYRFKPAFGFIDIGTPKKLEITRLEGPARDDIIVSLSIQYLTISTFSGSSIYRCCSSSLREPLSETNLH